MDEEADDADRFGRADLIDYDHGRSGRPRIEVPTLEFQCDAPGPAFVSSFVYGLWQDFTADSGLDTELSYVLKGCIVIGLTVLSPKEDDLVGLRYDFNYGVYNDLVARYKVFRVRCLKFPPISDVEREDFAARALDEIRFDLSEVRRSA
jgi:hypothetical protein